MDAQNERKVFKRITASSCGKKLPQYFMITPKLITDLQYHKDTKVIIIMNGVLGLPQKGTKAQGCVTERFDLRQTGTREILSKMRSENDIAYANFFYSNFPARLRRFNDFCA